MSHYHLMLNRLLDGFDVSKDIAEVEIFDLSLDSRLIRPGCLFIALKGTQTDGRKYIAEALKNEAAAVVYDGSDGFEIDQVLLDTDKLYEVRGLAESVSQIAARFYARPSRKMDVIGITGTNGKTTIAYYLAQLLEKLGRSSAVIGTLGAGKIDHIQPTGLTTADAIQTQKTIAQLLEDGVQAVCMEVSSHGLAQARVNAVDFDYVVFTNLSQDHLDYHQNMEDYAAAKSRLFNDFNYQCAIINQEDNLGAELIEQLGDKSLAYGVDAGALQANNIELTSKGLSFEVVYAGEKQVLENNLIGYFNIYNMLAVIGVGLTMGYALVDIVDALTTCRSAPGRMECVNFRPDQPVVVVDYAHTPKALEVALAACKKHCKGSLNLVFGCGGDRDKDKRASMGRIAEQLADQIFITDDNPRGEAPAVITNDIIKGMTQPAWVVHDRTKAITAAIGVAQQGDWVLIAGKGHETAQVYADYKLELDDRAVARPGIRESGCMMMLSEASIAMQGTLSGQDKRFLSVEFDTRRLEREALFFAIHGESKNGHDFIPQAMEKQALAAVVDQSFNDDQNISHIKVKDTTIALGMLAAYWRARFDIPVVGITGSNGKTSVTNLVSKIFSYAIPGVAPQGSFNNQWGVPLTLLGLREKHLSAVIEMGMNHAGELTYLGQIVKPTIGLITNAAAAHLEGLGDVEGVARAKGELIDSVAADGLVILNRDDAFYADWKSRAEARKVMSFGVHAKADVRLVNGDLDTLELSVQGRMHRYVFPLLGRHNRLNAAAAVAVAIAAGVPQTAIRKGLENASAVKGRLQMQRVTSDLVLIDDTYNANPSSVMAAIDVLVERNGQKILVLGAMAELGNASSAIHQEVAEYAKKSGVDYLLTLVDQTDPGYLNDMAAYMSGFGDGSFAFSKVSQLVNKVAGLKQGSQSVLVKGSRATRMERVVEALNNIGGAQC